MLSYDRASRINFMRRKTLRLIANERMQGGERFISHQQVENMKFSAKSTWTGIIATSLLLGVFGEIQAQAAGQSVAVEHVIAAPSSLARQAAFDRALNEDAMHFAEAGGIPLQAVVAQLKIEEALAQPAGELRAAYGDRLAGIYIEHKPTPRMVVRLKGAASQATRFFDTSAGVIPVDFVVGAAHTQAELEGMIDAKLSALKLALPELQGTATDDKTGEVVLDVWADSAQAAKLQSVANTILGVPTRVRVLPVPLTQEVRGSGSIDGGSCTGAFVVKKTDGSATGLLTAGHCPNNNASYTGLDGAVVSLTFKAEAYTASNDVQWYTTNTTDEPILYMTATAARTLSGRRTQASTMVGDKVCHYGVTSGYSCGTFELTNYKQTYSCNGLPCATTYIAVTGPGTK